MTSFFRENKIKKKKQPKPEKKTGTKKKRLLCQQHKTTQNELSFCYEELFPFSTHNLFLKIKTTTVII